MAEIPFAQHYQRFEKWLSVRSQRDRLLLLAGGCLVIFLFWYSFVQEPIQVERSHLLQETDVNRVQIHVFATETQKILKNAAIQSERRRQQRTAQSLTTHKIELANASENDRIIKEILTAENHVQFVGLKTVPGTLATGNTLELSFSSNYVDTLAYLRELEKIPWCLSWNAINYNVTSYPDAAITVNVSIVSG